MIFVYLILVCVKTCDFLKVASSRLVATSSNSLLNGDKGGPKFKQSNRQSSSSHGKSGFGASGIVYTLLGAGLAGVALAVNFLNSLF